MHPPVLIIRMERVIIFKVNRRVEVVSKPFAYVCVCVHEPVCIVSASVHVFLL